MFSYGQNERKSQSGVQEYVLINRDCMSFICVNAIGTKNSILSKRRKYPTYLFFCQYTKYIIIGIIHSTILKLGHCAVQLLIQHL